MSAWRGVNGSLWAHAVLLAASLAVSSPALLGGRSWIPSDFYASTPLFGANPSIDPGLHQILRLDILENNYNRDRLLHHSLAAGEYPLWDPTFFCGQALYRQTGAALHYPPRIFLFWLFEPDRAFTLFLWLHLWLAGVAMFLLCRELGRSTPASLLGGLTWMLCGKTAALFAYDDVLPHLAWLPLVFACGVHLTWRRALWGSLALALAMLSTYHYYQLASSVLLTAFIATRWRGHALQWTAMAGAALLMWLPYLVPTMEMMADSDRVDVARPEMTLHSERLAIAATMVAPRLLGGPTQRVSLYREWGLPNPVEFQVYVGLAPLALACVGLFAGRNGSRFFAAGAVVTLLLTFVHPLNSLAHLLVPSRIETIYRMCYLFSFCAAPLAAQGLDALLADPERMRRIGRRVARIAGAGAALGAVGSMAAAAAGGPAGRWLGPSNDHVFVPLLLSVALCALFAAARTPRALAAGAVLLALAELGLFFVQFNPTFDAPLPPGIPEPLAAAQRMPHARAATDVRNGWFDLAHPAVATYYGIRTAGGYDDHVTPRYHRLAGALGGTMMSGGQSVSFPDAHPLLGRLGVQIHIRGREWRPVDAPPRAIVVGRAERAASADAALERLLDPAFDPRGSVILEEAGPAEGEPGSSPARFLIDGGNRVEIGTESAAPGWLVLSDAYDRFWRCTVDGNEAPILRANYLFRAVRLPAGAHRVEFTYRPVPFLVAVGISVSAAAAIALALAVSHFRDRGRRHG